MAEDFRQLQRVLTAHLRDPEHNPPPPGIPEERLAVYRRLFFNNVLKFITGALPVLTKIQGMPRMREMARAFYAQHRCKSPYFNDISKEFIDFLNTEFEPADTDPPFMAELAHYERVELELSLCDAPIDWDAIDPDGDLRQGAPVLSPLTRLLEYRWPVHEVGPSYRPAEPPAEPVHLVACRDRNDAIHFVRCNRVTARLLDNLRRHPERSGLAQVAAALEQCGLDATEAAVAGGLDSLARLKEQDIVLGARATAAAKADKRA